MYYWLEINIYKWEDTEVSQFTKKAIIAEFLELLREQSLDRITVKDIVERCGINRNTFYYYYKDIYDLIDDIFDFETKRVISEEKYDSWQDELKRVVVFVMENRDAIAHVYYSKSREVLEKYLFDISDILVQDYVINHEATIRVSEENKRFISTFYSYSLSGMLLNWIKGGMQENSTEFLQKLGIVFENTIRVALESNDPMI
jgi:AcrR family transcriptional regulator